MINIKTKNAIGILTPAGYKMKVKGANDGEYTGMLLHEFIWTLFSGEEIPDGMKVCHINGSVTDNNVTNLSLQDEYQPYSIYNLYEANDRGMIRHIKTKKLWEK